VDAPPLVRFLAQKLAPLRLSVNAAAEPRVNMLVPTVDLEHFFGAYIGKFNLARRLAEQGLRVRIVAVDPTKLPDDWRDQVRGYEGLDSLLDKVEVEFALDRDLLRLEVSPKDCFVATTSWTAHLAHRATQEVDRERFVFVIQEYDPLVFPVGTMGAVSRQAYTFPHFAVFSTEFLREYFRVHGLGVYADGADQGERASVSFQNAITAVDPPAEAEMRKQANSLLFYARPEQHAERNMFELGVMALAESIHDGCFPGAWRFYGIGAMEPSRVRITDQVSMEILARQSQDAHPAPEPGPARDGVGRDAGGHKHLREQDGGFAASDLAEPGPGGAHRRRDQARASRGGRRDRRRRATDRGRPDRMEPQLAGLAGRRADRADQGLRRGRLGSLRPRIPARGACPP
jgi:hypothetical protein